MPTFPHTLIGLGSFADQGCDIVFTKTAVTVYHPDDHPILSGWRDKTGPRLWHFPLTAEAAQVASDDASPQPPIPSPPPRAPSASIVINPRKQKRVSVSARKQKRVSVPVRTQERSCNSAVKHRRHSSPRQGVTFTLSSHHVDKDSTIWRRVHPEKRTTYRIDSLAADGNGFQFPPSPPAAPVPSPSLTPLPGHLHPSQGILATSATGAACSVYYLYGAAQAVALAA